MQSEPLVVVEVTEPENGSVEISADQQGIRYTPDEGFSGDDTFQYTTCDPAGLCDSTFVLVTIDPASTDPFVFDDRESTKGMFAEYVYAPTISTAHIPTKKSAQREKQL